MTREHVAWVKLVKRIAYLNSFAGNRGEMEKVTRIVKEIWEETKKEASNGKIKNDTRV